ncbi:MAG: mechanosensitive ion channel [FCB group bacterium]|nr:mechanosensitive ion channel [FCB group bacterium]MBL7029461.1 mechanosensitive ion channel [Candidatus Neomarinimicrobiota bacterium]MBL7121483.1 mechanosensitive ion channel [Candidatus Neomarinimicrobiota bacterium]
MAGVAWLVARRVRPFLTEKVSHFALQNRLLINLIDAFVIQLVGFHLIILLWISNLVYAQLGIEALVLELIATLVTVWVLIKLASAVIFDRFWSVAVSITAWGMAALIILDVFDPMVTLLDKIAFSVGEVHISLLSLLKAGLLLLIALRLGGWLTGYIDKQLHRIPQLTASARVLISKTSSGLIYFIIALVVFNSIGIDFTALAVFGGALGVGIGFGLQKVVSNLISGIILLSDRSIKPGDVVQIGEVYGWISSLRARYVSVVTHDGHEYLIPNEDLITQQVINWSYSDTKVRVRIPFGVSYNADPHQVQSLALEAMESIPRIIKHPSPICLLWDFGDSSVDMELLVWIDDPKNGMGNIKSDVLFKVWDVLKENNIEIPFPQRDLHIKNDPEKLLS